MTIITLGDKIVMARKHHECMHCGGIIAPKTEYRKATYKYDDVYTWRTHLDCEDLYEAWLKFHDLKYWYFDDGYPPMIEAWLGGDFDIDCSTFRGRFPHPVCRMELLVQRSSNRKPNEATK